MKKLLFDGLGRVVPMNALSFVTGAASRVQLPQPLNKVLCKGFAASFGIDLTEADQNLDSYKSIEDLFTRKLKDGARPIQGEPCSPADGILSIAGQAVNNTAVQAKGLTYSLSELMFGDTSSDTDVKLSYYATVYLAPHNYHRVHSPVAGVLQKIRYFPGELWPVNKPSVRWTPRLFTRNERLVFEIDTQGGHLYLAMVGALNVGRMVTPHLPDFASNESRLRLAKKGSQVFELPEGHKIVCGQELGTFMLGSTVIIAFDEQLAKRYRMVQAWSSRPIRMGEKLGE